VPGGGGDDVVAHGLQVAEGRAVHLAVGDHAGEVVAGLDPAVLGDAVEVHHEVHDHGLDGVDAVGVPAHLLAGPVDVRVGAAEQLLGQLEHARLVRFRHADHLHDDVQGIEEGHVPGEVAAVAVLGHAVDEAPGDLADPLLQLAQVLRHEPALGQAPVGHVVGVVHLDQGADEVGAAAHHLAHLPVGLDGGQGRRPVAIVEQLVLPLDLQDVGVAGDHPEGIEAFRLGLRQRGFPAQVGEGVVDPLAVGIGAGVDNGQGDVLGDHGAAP